MNYKLGVLIFIAGGNLPGQVPLPSLAQQTTEKNAIVSKASQIATLQPTPKLQVLYFTALANGAKDKVARIDPVRPVQVYADESSSRPHTPVTRADAVLESMDDFAPREMVTSEPSTAPTQAPPAENAQAERFNEALGHVMDRDPAFAQHATDLIGAAYDRPFMVGGEPDPIPGPAPTPSTGTSTPLPMPALTPGSQMDVGEFPECVALCSGTQFIGSGVLLSPHFVLTAQHVLDAGPNQVYIGPSFGDVGGQYYPLASGPNATSFRNADGTYPDLVLIHLAGGVNLSSFPTIADSADNVSQLETVVLAGYGTTNPTASGAETPYRRYVSIPLSPSYCACNEPFNPAQMLCGIKLINGHPALPPLMVSECKGDSGGPAYTSETGHRLCAIITDSFGLDAANGPNHEATVCGNGGVYVRLDVFSKALTRYIANDTYSSTAIVSNTQP